jgi:hypothetical protein
MAAIVSLHYGSAGVKRCTVSAACVRNNPADVGYDIPPPHTPFSARCLMAGKGESTAYESKDRDDDSGKTDVYFNRDGDGEAHGHVVTSDDGATTHYARDEDGAVYVDDSKK